MVGKADGNIFLHLNNENKTKTQPQLKSKQLQQAL
jgi:hypothetical protein